MAQSHSQGAATEVGSRPRRKARRPLSFRDYVTERDRAILTLQSANFGVEEIAAVLQVSVRLVEIRRVRLQRLRIKLVRQQKAADNAV
jgi:hypothetical protein